MALIREYLAGKYESSHSEPGQKAVLDILENLQLKGFSTLNSKAPVKPIKMEEKQLPMQ
jgi:hypothetical protein